MILNYNINKKTFLYVEISQAINVIISVIILIQMFKIRNHNKKEKEIKWSHTKKLLGTGDYDAALQEIVLVSQSCNL